MKYCKQCGDNIPKEAVYCPICGGRQDAPTAKKSTNDKQDVMNILSGFGVFNVSDSPEKKEDKNVETVEQNHSSGKTTASDASSLLPHPADNFVAKPLETETPIAKPLEVETPIGKPLDVETPIAKPLDVETPETPIAKPLEVEAPIIAPLDTDSAIDGDDDFDDDNSTLSEYNSFSDSLDDSFDDDSLFDDTSEADKIKKDLAQIKYNQNRLKMKSKQDEKIVYQINEDTGEEEAIRIKSVKAPSNATTITTSISSSGHADEIAEQEMRTRRRRQRPSEDTQDDDTSKGNQSGRTAPGRVQASDSTSKKRRESKRQYFEDKHYAIEQESIQVDEFDPNYDGYYENVLPVDHDEDRSTKIDGVLVAQVSGILVFLFGLIYAAVTFI